MAAEEKVIIRIEIDADINKDLAAIEAKLKALEKRSNALNKTNTRLDRSTNKLDKRFSKFNNTLSALGSTLGSFVKTLSKLSFIALTAQVALFTATLVGVKAALVTGRFAVRAYQASLTGLSIAAASVATALTVAVAAMREFSEVQLSPYFGGTSGIGTAARYRRQLATSPIAGLIGGEETAAITAALARANVPINTQSALTTQLFNLSGGDPAATAKLAQALTGGDFESAQTALSEAVGFKQDSLTGITDMAGLISAISAGTATSEAFNSLADDMAKTFIGTLKTEFVGFKELFADIGEPLLEPFRITFMQISRIIKDDFIALSGIVQKFGADSLAPTLVDVVDKVSAFFRSNIINNLERIDEISENFTKFFSSMRDWLRSVGDWFKALEPAADVVIDMFKAMGGAAGGRKLFQTFQQLVLDNAEAFVAFGESIGNVFGAIFDFLSAGQGGFFAKLPTLIDSFNVVAEQVIPALGRLVAAVMPLFEQLPTILEGLAQIINAITPVVATLASAIADLISALPTLMAGVAAFGLTKGGRALVGGAFSGGVMGGGGVLGRGGRGNLGPLAIGLPLLGMGVINSYQSGGGAGGTTTSAIGGALSGMALGSVIGANAGPLGAAAFAVGGAIIGGVSSWIAGKAGKAAIQRSVKSALGDAILQYRDFSVGDFRDLGSMSLREDYIDEMRRTKGTLNEAFATIYSQKNVPTIGNLAAAVTDIISTNWETELSTMDAVSIAEQILDGGMNADFQKILDSSPSAMDKFNEAMNTPTSVEDALDEWKRTSLDNYVATMELLSDKTGKTVDELEKLDPMDLTDYIYQFQKDLGEKIIELQPVFDTMQENLDYLTSTLNMSEDAVNSLLDEFGFLIDTVNAVNFANFISQLERANQIANFDKNQTFVPSTLETPAGIEAAKQTVMGVRDELFAAAGQGNYDIGAFERYTDAQMTYQVATGTDPYLAYISSIQALISETQTTNAANLGVDPAEFIGQFDLVGQYNASLDMIEEALGVAIPNMIRGLSPDEIGSWVNTQQDQARAFRDVSYGDTTALSNLSDDILNRFADFTFGENFQGTSEDKQQALLDKYDQHGLTLQEQKDLTADLRNDWATFNSNVLDIDGVRNSLLEQILAEASKEVAINVSGDVSETGYGEVVVSLRVTKVGGNGNEGSRAE